MQYFSRSLFFKSTYLLCILLLVHNNCKAQNRDFSKSFFQLNAEILKNEDSAQELNPLLSQASKSEIIAIGEATHGTQEIQQFQILLTKILIEKYNLTTVILGEVGSLRSFQIHDFLVNRKRGNEISDSFPQLNDLITWIDNFNKKTAKKVTILGVENDSPEFTLGFINNHFTENEKIGSLLHELFISWKNKNSLDLNNINSIIDTLHTDIKKEKGKSDSLDFKIDLMLRSLSHLKTSFIYRENAESLYLKRDSIVFNNIVWLKENTKDSKLSIISTHNFHVNKRRIMKSLFKETHTLGELLTEKYQEKYYPIATEIAEGTFSHGESTFQNVVKHKNKLGNIISKKYKDTSFGILMVDKNSINFLKSHDLQITLGTGVSNSIPTYGLLSEAFNTFIYIKKSTPYKLINVDSSFLISLQLDSILNLSGEDKSLTFNLGIVGESIQIANTVVFLDAFGYPILINKESSILTDTNYKYIIPPNTKSSSIWLIVKNQNKLEINQIILNGTPLTFDKVSVIDSENLGFKKNVKGNKLIISK